jgi:hypothetical protein
MLYIIFLEREGRHKPIYFLPTVQEYLRELNRLADDATLAEWSQEKKDKQAERVQVRSSPFSHYPHPICDQSFVLIHSLH